MATDDPAGLDPNIIAALDQVLFPGACETVLLNRLRRLVENCLADNYDASDVLAVIELSMAGDEGAESTDGA